MQTTIYKIILIAQLQCLCIIAMAQEPQIGKRNLKMKTEDYYGYIMEGVKSYNAKEFKEAEDYYLKALQLLKSDSAGKGTDPGNHAIGELIILNHLIDVNKWLKDEKDIANYKKTASTLERKYAKRKEWKIYSYFANKAEEKYNIILNPVQRKVYGEDFWPSLLNDIELALINCDEENRASIQHLQYKILAFYYGCTPYSASGYKTALAYCDKALAQDPKDCLILDLKGHLMWYKDSKQSCQSWQTAYQLGCPKAKLRFNKYCK
jgi:tetratricopeptide (TPR) repeat protein